MASGNETGTGRSKSEEETDLIARVWYQHGLFCATHPKLVIFSTVVVIFICR